MASDPIQNYNVNFAKYDEKRRINDNLWYAARDGNVDEVSRLLAAGGDPNYYADADENSTLLIAAKNGHTEIVRLLLHLPGTLENWTNKDKDTIFHLAAANGHLDILNLLIDKFVSIDIILAHNKYGLNSLHLSAANGHVRIVDRILSILNQTNIKWASELTPKNQSVLSLAAQNGHLEVVDRLLAEPSIDPYINAMDRDGATPLKLAAINDHVEIVRHLLAKGALPMYHIPKSIHLHPDIIQAMNDVKRKDFELLVPPVIPIRVGDRIKVPLATPSGVQRIPNEPNCTVREVGPCRWELTESKLSEFFKFINNIETTDPELKEALHYLYPSMYSIEGPISKLSNISKFRNKQALLELMRTLNSEMDIESRRAKLIEISRFPEYDLRILQIVKGVYGLIKNSQVIKVEFDDKPGVFGFYVAHDCSQDKIHFIAEKYMIGNRNNNNNVRRYIDGITPTYYEDNIISVLPSKYILDQITEINSWITHGLLSLYLVRPDIVKAVCTNPLVGSEGFWRYVQDMMETQFTILYNISRPIDRELQVYRGSPYFQTHAVRRRSIFATSKNVNIANAFHEHAKVITIPPGTRILDLSDINKDEQEILIFPSLRDANMIVEPVNIGKPNKRNTYRIRNVENRNRNTPRSRRVRQRRRTQNRR